MTGTNNGKLVGAGVVVAGLLGTVLAQGMMGQQDNGQGRMGAGMMGSGMGMMSTYAPSSHPISQDEARRRADGFAARYGPGVKIRDFMVFTQNYYVQIVDARTGAGLAELLVDRYTGVVQPEFGPNMLWNTRFGMGGNAGMMGGTMMGANQNQGMMGGQTNQSGMMNGQNQDMSSVTQPGQGMMGNKAYQGTQGTPAAVRYNIASAQKLADTFVAGYLPGGKVLEGLAFPGCYTFDYGRKAIEGMLSVNASTGEVWVHVWHGLFLGEVK